MSQIDTTHWENIRDRIPDSLANLYDGFAGAMFSLALEVLGDRWEAEEVIQDVFAYVWKKPEAFSPEKGKFSSWLLVITRNRSIDRIRSRKRKVVSGEPIEALSNRPDHNSQDGADEAVKSDERSYIQEAFGQLPQDQRHVIELSYFKGLNHQEISEQLHLSLGTVKSRIRLGMEKLKRALSSLRSENL
jgi:RNA polymerase sigma-70 factor (ECF subfamily)